jgi:hypothetical protein
MIISIASGKGGTGKTTIATNLAVALAPDVKLLDCDVEEPNDHIFIRPVACRSPHLPFQIAVELLALHAAVGKGAAIHLPAQPEIYAGEISKGGKSRDVRGF